MSNAAVRLGQQALWVGVGAGVSRETTCPGATVEANGNATKAGVLSEYCSRLRRCSHSQRCTMCGCKPRLKATPDTDAPRSRVCCRNDAFGSARYSHRSQRSPSINRSIVPTISFVGTILDYIPRFKMGGRTYGLATGLAHSSLQVLKGLHGPPCANPGLKVRRNAHP